VNRFLAILTVILIFSVQSAFSQDTTKIVTDGYQVFYHGNGKIASEGTMRAGKPDGYWKTYNEDGLLVSEGNRKNFELDSTWKFYDDKGKLSMEINYLKGKKDGIRKSYREDEIVDETFKNDVKEGPTTYYYPDGRIKKQVNFKYGLEDGLAKEFDTDGRIITLINYKSGFITERELINRYDNNGQKHGMWKFFYADGKIMSEGNYKHGKENGYFKEYDKDGNLISTAKYADGTKLEDVAELVKLDVRKDYYSDGKVKIAASYNKEGQLEGVRREYAEDGSVEKSYIFKKGIMIGEGIVTEKGERDGYWKEYYDSGVLRAEGKYNKDVKEGPWKYYHENGIVDEEGMYRNGKPEGAWTWYYTGGQLLREENYYNGLEDGQMTEYDEAGNVITKGEFLEGNEEGEWYYRVGDNETAGTYAQGMRNGEWKYYDVPADPGKPKVLRFEGRFIEDNPHGKQTTYWDNGSRKEEGEYVMGRKEGEWVYYNYDGTPFIVVSYKNGVEYRYDGITITEGKTPVADEEVDE
jgi:antitoxin component YwqK of YwqJK toxin-antitoxin module